MPKWPCPLSNAAHSCSHRPTTRPAVQFFHAKLPHDVCMSSCSSSCLGQVDVSNSNHCTPLKYCIAPKVNSGHAAPAKPCRHGLTRTPTGLLPFQPTCAKGPLRTADGRHHPQRAWSIRSPSPPSAACSLHNPPASQGNRHRPILSRCKFTRSNFPHVLRNPPRISRSSRLSFRACRG